MSNKKNEGEKEFEGKYLDIWRSPRNSNDEFDFRISKSWWHHSLVYTF